MLISRLMENNRKTLRETLNCYGKGQKPFMFVVSYDLSEYYVEYLEKLPKEIKISFNNKNIKSNKIKTIIEKKPIEFRKYKDKFDLLMKEIKNGNTYLANLTSPTEIYTNYSLNEIYDNVDSKYKIRFNKDENDFVCFSPETFVEIVDNKICTYPMKGTIDASIKNASKIILNDKKEMSEHAMVVDLLRNDLGMIAKSIEVDKFRYITKINAGQKELLQVSSKVSGILDDSWRLNIGDIIAPLLPAGSITGAPKRKTVQILNKIEEYNRKFYSGIFGIFDGENLHSAVMIRFIEKVDGRLVYKSGGGITYDSDAEKEYKELIDKVYLPF